MEDGEHKRQAGQQAAVFVHSVTLRTVCTALEGRLMTMGGVRHRDTTQLLLELPQGS
jgi:hypothetical protein